MRTVLIGDTTSSTCSVSTVTDTSILSGIVVTVGNAGTATGLSRVVFRCADAFAIADHSSSRVTVGAASGDGILDLRCRADTTLTIPYSISSASSLRNALTVLHVISIVADTLSC